MCYLLKTQKPYVSVSYSKNQSDETVSMTPEQTWSAEENQKLQEKNAALEVFWGFLLNGFVSGEMTDSKLQNSQY